MNPLANLVLLLLLPMIVVVGAAVWHGAGCGRSAGSMGWRPASAADLPMILALGIGMGAVLQFAAMVVDVGPRVPQWAWEFALATVACGVLGVTAWRHKQRPRSATPTTVVGRRRGRSWPTWLLAICVMFAAVVAMLMWILHAARAPEGGYDAWAIWNLRATLMLTGGEDWRIAFDPVMSWSHTDYPLLLPLTVFRGWRLVETNQSHWPAMVALLFSIALVGMVGVLTARVAGRLRALVVTLFLLSLPVLVREGAAQYADVPLATFMAGAMGMTAVAWQRDRGTGGCWVVAGLLAGFAAFTKNEGLVFALCLSGSVVIGLLLRGSRRPIACWLLGVAPGLLCVAWQKLTLEAANDLVSNRSPGVLWALLTDADRHAMVAEAWLQRVPGIVPPLLLLTLMAVMLLAPVRVGLRRPGVLVVLAVPLVVQAAAYHTAYVIVSGDLLTWYLGTSLDRLVVQWLPMALLWLALAGRVVGAKLQRLGATRGGAGAAGTT